MLLHSLFPTTILYNDSVPTQKYISFYQLIMYFTAVHGKHCPPSDSLKVTRHFIRPSFILSHPAIRKPPFTSTVTGFHFASCHNEFSSSDFFFFLNSVPQLKELDSYVLFILVNELSLSYWTTISPSHSISLDIIDTDYNQKLHKKV